MASVVGNVVLFFFATQPDVLKAWMGVFRRTEEGSEASLPNVVTLRKGSDGSFSSQTSTLNDTEKSYPLHIY